MQKVANNYEEYTRIALEQFERTDVTRRNELFETVKHLDLRRILDVGCGAGQQFFQFLERSDAHCFGVDIAPELGKVTRGIFAENYSKRINFICSKGEELPFECLSFDVVLCLVALPYMNNRRTFAEITRVLKPNGMFILKIHAPSFYYAMIRQRVITLNAKQIAYPLICLAAGIYHSASGRQLEKGFWKGKEIYQTRRFLKNELAKNDLQIIGELPNESVQSPSFIIVKNQ